MTVFIGWAGETSKEIASILKNWLNGMFDGFVSAVTPDDLPMGSRWFDTLDSAMYAAECGLLCVTADNVNSQWLSYEAGALSRNVNLLAPVLFGVSSLQLGAPLRMFQPISFGADGMRELARTLNNLNEGNAIDPQELERRFQARYPTLEALLKEKFIESKPQSLEWRDEKSKEKNSFKPAVATTYNNLATLLAQSNRYEKAEALYLEALKDYRTLAKGNPSAFAPDVAMTCNNLANLFAHSNRYEEAEALYREALDIRRSLAEDNPAAFAPDVAMTCNNLANLLAQSNRYEEAEALYREALKYGLSLAEERKK